MIERYKLLIILFEIFFGVKLNLIGTISISELFLFVYCIILLKKIRFKDFPEIKTITYLYGGLLLSQIISETLIGNSLTNSLKGISITIVSYLHFLFLFYWIAKDKSIILYIIVGCIIRTLIFKSDFKELDVQSLLLDKSAGLIKFYIAPLLIYTLLILSTYLKRKISILLFSLTGLTFITLGARSYGLIILLTAIVTYFTIYNKIITKRKIIVFCTFICMITYPLYTIYVNKVLSGEIKNGNSKQLLHIQDPYNPVNLLIFGRSDSFVDIYAFMDKPLTGHGAWAIDKGGKYHLLMFKITNQFPNSNENYKKSTIPSHSVLIGAGMMNGIFAFIFMFSIILFFLKKSVQAINTKDKYIMILIYSSAYIIWTALFSPQSHFRIDLPFYFALNLALYYYTIKSKKKLNVSKYLSNNSNVRQ